MKKIITLATAAAFTAVVNIQAQNSPVGIVSVQDSVKSVQIGVISSVATVTVLHTTSSVWVPTLWASTPSSREPYSIAWVFINNCRPNGA